MRFSNPSPATAGLAASLQAAINYFTTATGSPGTGSPAEGTYPGPMKGISLFNTSPTSNLFVVPAGPGLPSALNFMVKLVPGAYYEAPLLAGGLPYQSGFNCAWDVVSTGGVMITVLF